MRCHDMEPGGRGSTVLLCCCRIQLVPLAESFQRHLVERLRGDGLSRDQVFQLCIGMHRVRMPMDSAADVSAAITAMQCFNPLQPVWKDVQKKSRVQHHLCQMLCAILHALVQAGMILFTPRACCIGMRACNPANLCCRPSHKCWSSQAASGPQGMV